MTILSAIERLDLQVPLIAGHLLADFVLQADRVATQKDRWSVLLGHVSVVAVASWALIGHATGAVALLDGNTRHYRVHGAVQEADLAAPRLPSCRIISCATDIVAAIFRA